MVSMVTVVQNFSKMEEERDESVCESSEIEPLELASVIGFEGKDLYMGFALWDDSVL